MAHTANTPPGEVDEVTEVLMATLRLRNRIVKFLETVKDADTSVDVSNWREDVSECRVTVGGIRFQVCVNAIEEADEHQRGAQRCDRT